MTEDLRIIFLGTPDFAVASLKQLVENNFNVVAVVTAPDKPAGRGMKLHQSAIKTYAVEKGIPVLQPEKLKNPEFINSLKNLKPDLQVVVAFRMLPEVVWSLPTLGTINVHASLLPQYRGAAPINWAIINGEQETGVTTFKLVHEIDKGNILLQEKVAIGDNETAGELYERLKETGSQLLVKTIKGLQQNNIAEINQQVIGVEEKLKHAPKIFSETCKINWDKPVEDVYNLIRGLSPQPGAYCMVHGKVLKIFSSEKEKGVTNAPPGYVKTDGELFIKFACADGWISVTNLQLEGKKRMTAQEFLRGNRKFFEVSAT